VLSADEVWQRDGLNHAAATSRAVREGDLAGAVTASVGLMAAFGAELCARVPATSEGPPPHSARMEAVRGLLRAVEAGLASGDLKGARAAARAVEAFLGALAASDRVTRDNEYLDD